MELCVVVIGRMSVLIVAGNAENGEIVRLLAVRYGSMDGCVVLREPVVSMPCNDGVVHRPTARGDICKSGR